MRFFATCQRLKSGDRLGLASSRLKESARARARKNARDRIPLDVTFTYLLFQLRRE
jgi:hypothetical protein